MALPLSKIQGSFIGAAIGDAMGAPTEARTTKMIKEKFGGLVKEFFPCPEDTFGRGNAAGLVTDDFCAAYFTAMEIALAGGKVSREGVQRALVRFSGYPQYYDNHVGPTTKAAVERLKNNLPPEEKKTGFVPVCINSKATNGAAMKIGPVGLFTPGDLDKSVENAVEVSLPTHDNYLAISGACAISAAVSAAVVNGASLKSIVDAGLYGAKKGYEIAERVAKPVSGPSVYKRIALAYEIGLKYKGDFEKAMDEIGGVIGSGLLAVEAVPAVFGILAAVDLDPMESIYMGVNIGDDTDTVATMAGAIVGGFHGADAFPKDDYAMIQKMNPDLDIPYLAGLIEGVVNHG